MLLYLHNCKLRTRPAGFFSLRDLLIPAPPGTIWLLLVALMGSESIIPRDYLAATETRDQESLASSAGRQKRGKAVLGLNWESSRKSWFPEGHQCQCLLNSSDTKKGLLAQLCMWSEVRISAWELKINGTWWNDRLFSLMEVLLLGDLFYSLEAFSREELYSKYHPIRGQELICNLKFQLSHSSSSSMYGNGLYGSDELIMSHGRPHYKHVIATSQQTIIEKMVQM